MFVRAIITEGINEQAILVPQQGVFRNPKGEAMALIVDNKNIVQQRTISVERTVGDKWLVSSGINPGDRVIVEGLQKVKPGASARVVPFKTDKN
jgi:membrane fusion protein (multidrug efflux system)